MIILRHPGLRYNLVSRGQRLRSHG